MGGDGQIKKLTHPILPSERMPRSAAAKSRNATRTQAPPTQARSSRPPMASVTEPSAAPSENPRYWKELLRERMIGAFFGPAMPIRRPCCGGKKPHAVTPHTATAAKTERNADEGAA